MSRRLLSALALAAVVAGCPRGDAPAETPVQAADPAVLKAALDALGARLQGVRDYEVEGTVEDVASKQQLRFRYSMMQPQLASASIGDARSFVFDGKQLVIIDHGSKTVVRQDLSGDEQRLLLTIHEVFSQFVSEGWRPPLIRPQGSSARSESGPDGERWIVEVPIDDPALQGDRVILRAPKADFLARETRDRQGNVVRSVRVLEEHQDATSGLSYPKAWEATSAEGTQRVRLDKIQINAGVPAERFSTATPAGYVERSAP